MGMEYILDDDRWNHTNSMKYYASGKAGYTVNDNIEFGLSASYYQGEMNFNGFEISSYSSYVLDGTWDDPRNSEHVPEPRLDTGPRITGSTWPPTSPSNSATST